MRLVKLVFLVVASIWASGLCYAATYYVSNTGSDSAAGTSTATAWKTIAKVNAASLNSGDQILFQSGGTWREMLSPTAGNLYFGVYGTGARPIITGSDLITGTWTKAGTYSCSMKVGGSDLTEVWMKGVLGIQVASAAQIFAPGEWFYSSNGTLTLGISGGCTSAITTPLAIEITRRSYALYVNNIGAITVEHIAFMNGMYNTIYLGANLTSTQTFNDVVWQGARYEGFIASGGTPVITGSEGLNSLSGMAAAGGNGFTLTNSILSGNIEDAIEIYGTNGASTILNSTISGNSTAQPLYTTISNWSSYPLKATNSVLLPNPYIPQTYSFIGLTDDGTNIETSPLFTQRAAPLIIMPFIDDYINLGVAQAVAAAAKQYGCTLSYALNTKLVTPTDWTTIAAMQKAGTDIVAHTRSHSDLANNNVFSIRYTGTATNATMTINQTAGTLQTFLNGSTTPDLTVQILDKYNSIQIMCNSINANTAYSCVVQPNQLYFTPLNLANVTNVSIKSGYMTQAAAGYLTWEVEGAQQDIAANIPGYTATTFATPFTSSNLTVENHIRDAGFTANRNGTVDSNLQPNGNWAFSNIDVYNVASDWLPDQYDFSHPAGSVGALVEALGASGGMFAVYSHGYDEFTLAQWTQLFQLLQQDGATCMTLTQARAYIGSHGTLVPDGTKKNWVEQVPLSPVFSTTSSSPTQGAHGLQ